MIGRLRGELLEIQGSTVTVECGGVGYEVLVPESVLVQLPAPGEFCDLRIRQVFREDGVSLYGFFDAFQRRVFDLLTDVKGCGPKIALSLLGQLGEQAVIGSILAGDAKALARANGVGPRLAERIILELKDKAAEESAMQRISAAIDGTRAAIAPIDDPLIEALLALGYRRQEAETAARDIDASQPVENRLKTALRSLAR
jgi:Holliday junction DNA helicase RuvA